MLVVHNPALQRLVRPQYSTQQLAEIRRLLQQRGTFEFHSLASGLFSAGVATAESEHTGYRAAWVRDNVHVAYAHYVNGQPAVAARTVKALCKFFQKECAGSRR